MQANLAGFTGTVTGGLVSSQGNGPSTSRVVRQLPTLSVDMTTNMTVTLQGNDTLRFKLGNLTLPIFTDVACALPPLRA
jgi:hypothetical protein